MSPIDPYQQFGVAVSGLHFGRRGTLDSVVSRMSQLRTADVVQGASKLMMSMEAVEGGGMRGVQTSLADSLYPDEVSDELRRLLARGPEEGGIDVLFYPQQLMSLQKLALAVGVPGAPTSFDERRDWGDFLLAAAELTDVIDDMSSYPYGASSGSDREAELAIFFLRNAEANRLTYYQAVAGRAYALWLGSDVAWPDDLEDPDSFCRRRFGVSMRRFMAICLAPAYARVNMVDPSPEEAVFDPIAYFGRAGINRDDVERVLSELTFPDRLPANAVDDASTYWAFTDFAARPYLRSSESTLVPSSVSRAFERGTTGIFWLMHASLAGDESALNPYTSHFGILFEDYCLRIALGTAPTNTRVQGEVTYLRGGEEVKSVDVLMSTTGRTAPARVFLECGTDRPVQSVYTHGDREAFNRYVARLVEKLEQLDRSVRDHRAGLFGLEADLAEINDSYLPMLVVDKPFQWTIHLRNVLDREIRGRGLFTGSDVAMPVVCDIGEYEHFWSVVGTGISPADVIREYLLDTDRAVAMERHLFNRYEAPPIAAMTTDGFEGLSDLLIEELELA